MSEARRLFATELPRGGGRVVLSEEASRHARVLRLEPGDALTLFDGDGWHAPATLREAGKRLVCDAGPAVELPDDGAGVELLLAVPRAGKLDDILRAVTELGVRAVHLTDCERCVGSLPPAKFAAKLARYEGVVREAARQCERDRVPRVHPPRALLEVAAEVPDGAGRVVLAARGDQPLPVTLPPRAWVAVGPEGGFTDRELDGLERLGYTPARVGRTILRVETAASAAVVLVADRLRAAQGTR